jgi:hypothetical protein
VTVHAKQTVSLILGSSGAYDSSTPTPNQLFDPGQTITIDVAGHYGDPPAFHLALSAPGGTTLTSPSGRAIVVDRTLGITFTWSPTYGDLVMLTIGGAGEEDLQCEWPMTDGQGLVPASLLSGLTQGVVPVQLLSGSRISQEQGRWQVVATATVTDVVDEVTVE